jgi:hypothetical protein
MGKPEGLGTTRGQVDGKFEARVKQLEQRAQKMSETFRQQNGARDWHTPDEMKDKELLDVPNLHEPSWNRDSINQIYSMSVLAGPGRKGGTTGDLVAMKWQADFMATEERGWRLRHASLIRCACFMHGRLDGHGQAKKSVFSFLKDGVQSHIDAGKS